MAREAELIGGRMRERRKELGLSQREIAEKIPGSAQGTDVSRWERGLHRPHSDTLDYIATALKTTVADLHLGPVADRKPKGETPDLFATPDGKRLAHIEAQLTKIMAHLEIDLPDEDAEIAETLDALDAGEAADEGNPGPPAEVG